MRLPKQTAGCIRSSSGHYMPTTSASWRKAAKWLIAAAIEWITSEEDAK